MRKCIASVIALIAWMFMASFAMAQALYFPPADGDWEQVDPEQVGWDKAGLTTALAVAGARSSSGVLIL